MRGITRTRLVLAALIAAAAALVVPATGASFLFGKNVRDLFAARSATASFQNVQNAQAAGYGLFRDAAGIACIANPPLGGMGIHYVNGSYVGDTVLDPRKPEALVYEPKRNGRLRLAALEYIVFQEAWDAEHSSPPSLFGHQFGLVTSPNRYGLPPFYELHVWIWKNNPNGLFFEWNPGVRC
jgi:hypothetical protein